MLIQQDMKKKAGLSNAQKDFINKATKISEESGDNEKKYKRSNYNNLVNEAKALFPDHDVRNENEFQFNEEVNEPENFYVLNFEPTNPYVKNSTGEISFGKRNVNKMMNDLDYI